MSAASAKSKKKYVKPATGDAAAKAMSWTVGAYVFLMLAVYPLYYQDKYYNMGDAKWIFFKWVSGVFAVVALGVFIWYLSCFISKHEFKKNYYAVVEGKLDKSGTFKDKLLKDSKTNTTKVSPLGKDSELSYELVSYTNGLSLVKIFLKTGRSHQIRVQFSSRGFPLFGDRRYNKKCNSGQIALFASGLEFVHPVTGKVMKFELDLPKRYPFSLFDS